MHFQRDNISGLSLNGSTENDIISKLLPHSNTVNLHNAENNKTTAERLTRISNFYPSPKIFNASRYHETCVAHIMLVTVGVQLNYFPLWNIYRPILYPPKHFVDSIIPGYLIGIFDSNEVKIPPTQLLSHFEAVRLVLLNIKIISMQIRSIHLGCHTFTAAIDMWKAEAVENMSRKRVAFEFIQLNALAVPDFKTSIEVYFKKFSLRHTYGFTTNFLPSNEYLTTTRCVPRKTNTHFTKAESPSVKLCVLGLYAEKRNCTNDFCFDRIDSEVRFFRFDMVGGRLNPKYLSVAIQSDEIKFFVMHSLDEEKRYKTLSALSFPFQPSVWVCLLASILFALLIVELADSSSGKSYNATFWLLSVLVEQDVYLNVVTTNWSGYFVATVWTLGMFVLRLFYTGDIYVGLTQHYIPTNVPRSFLELFHYNFDQKDFPLRIFSDKYVTGMINYELQKLDYLNKTHSMDGEIKENLKTLYLEEETVLSAIFNISEGKQTAAEFDTGWRQQKVKTSNYQTKGRVALLYNTVPAAEIYRNGAWFLKEVLLTIIGRRKMVHNIVTSSPLFTNLILWSSTNFFSSFLRDFEKVTSGIGESGFLEIFGNIQKTLIQRRVKQYIISAAGNCSHSSFSVKFLACSQSQEIEQGVKLDAVMPLLRMWFSLCLVCILVGILEKGRRLHFIFYDIWKY